MNKATMLAVAVVSLLAGCAAPLASMKPVAREGQDIIYDNGTPVVMSRGTKADVMVLPVTGATGRYEVGERVAFAVQVRNRSGERCEISEADFQLIANASAARTIKAVEMEDEIRSQARWARAANAISAAAASFSAASAGTSTSVVTTSGGTAAVIHTYDNGAAQTAQRQVANDAAASAAAIDERERVMLASLDRMLQRNTLQPGASVGGFVVMSVPRYTACSRQENTGAGPERSGGATATVMVVEHPCWFTLTANVAGELHSFAFSEVFATGEEAPPVRSPEPL